MPGDDSRLREKTAPSYGIIACRYAIVALACVAFNAIYAQFAHGVASPFMTFMFAIPLVMGVVPALVAHLRHVRSVPVAARQAWGLATACLVVASCLHGVFDIAGTASPYLPIYLVVAAGFAAVALVKTLRFRGANS